jgi:hypothetical protein
MPVQNIAAVLNPGGGIFIIGQILDDSRRSPLEAVEIQFNFYKISSLPASLTPKTTTENG